MTAGEGRYVVSPHFRRWAVRDLADWDADARLFDHRHDADAKARALNAAHTARMHPQPTLFDKDTDMPEPTPPPAPSPPVFADLPELFDDEIPAGIDRDGYGRPKIVPPGGGKPVPYTRVSTFAGYLDNAHGLMKWKVRNVALGVARNDDLRRMIAALAYGDALLDEHIETALTRMDDKAAWGTAVHSFTEPDASPYVPEEMAADVLSYHDKMKALQITPTHTELFVVNDILRVAGTLDHVYECPAWTKPRVGDKKSGKKKAQPVAIQLSCYAGSVIYNPETHERTPLDVDTDWGLLVHIPKEQGRTDVFPVDLQAGVDAARLAREVNAYTKRTDLLGAAMTFSDPILDLIEGATTRDELLGIHAEHKDDWTPAHTAAAKARGAAMQVAA